MCTRGGFHLLPPVMESIGAPCMVSLSSWKRTDTRDVCFMNFSAHLLTHCSRSHPRSPPPVSVELGRVLCECWLHGAVRSLLWWLIVVYVRFD